MAIVQNPVTGLWEDDGSDTVNPFVSPPVYGPPAPAPAPQAVGRRPDTALERQLATPDDTSPDSLQKDARRPVFRTSDTLGRPADTSSARDNIENWRAAEKAGLGTPVSAGAPDTGPAGPAGAAPLAPAGPPPLVTTGTQTTSTTGSSTPQLTAQGALAFGERANIHDREMDLADREGAAAKRNAGQALAETQRSNREQEAEAKAAQARIDAQQAAMDKLDKHIAEKTEEYANSKIEDFWAKKSNAAHFLSAIAVGLGAHAATIAGTRNMAADTLQQAIDNDFRIQKANIEKRKDVLELMRQDRAAAAEKKKGLYFDNEVKKLGLIEASKRRLAEIAAQNGVSDADLANDAVKLRLDKMYNDESIKLRKDLFREVESRTSTTTQKGFAPAGIEGGAAANALRGTDGQPVVTGTDAAGRPVYVVPHSAKGAETVAAFRDKYPTAMQNLKRLQELASAPASERAKAVASGEAKSLRHEVALTMATLESEGRAPSARLIHENEAIVPEVSIATIRDPAKVFGQIRDRFIDRAANIVQAQTNANAQTAQRLAQDWAGGAAGRAGGSTEGKRVRYRMADGRVVDAIQHADGRIEAVQ